ncbi:MAG: hypothetical protein ACP5N1_01150 [Candidatus Woesearchaeota archaeon]
MVRAISDKIISRHAYWKIHLVVRPENQKTVYDWLFDDNNCPHGWKYKYADQEDKDFTIYIGSYDDTLAFASKLLKAVGNRIELANEKTLWSDIEILSKISARFRVHEDSFTKYGFLGIPVLKVFSNNISSIFNKTRGKEKLEQYKLMIEKSHDVLRRAYGVYYYGSGEDFVKRFICPFLNKDTRDTNVSWHINYLIQS